MYCPYCGKPVAADQNFCPNCGAPLKENTASGSAAVKTSPAEGKYSLILVSKGSCSADIAGDLLEDVFGYTDSAADSLVKEAPVVVGQKMTAEEAGYVAQMFSEYGIEVSIQDENERYVDLSSKASNSVFDAGGNLLTNVLAVIGGLSVANRVTHYRRIGRPSALKWLFRPLFSPRPPVHKRYIRPRPAPVRPMVRPIPAPHNFGYRNSSDHVLRSDHGRRGGPGGRPGMMKRHH